MRNEDESDSRECNLNSCSHKLLSDFERETPSCNDDSKMAFSAIGVGGGGLQRSRSRVNSNDVDADEVDCCKFNTNRDKVPRAKREIVTLNVGGSKFESYRSTLKRLRTCKLAKDWEMKKYYREDKGEYFFDRDAKTFGIILNYLRSGELHLPNNVCGPALQNEFEFWGIDEMDIERCCWQPYNTWKTQTRSLEKLEYDRKQSTTQTDLAKDRRSKKWWKRWRAFVWCFLQDPTSSRGAKAYAYISVLFVFMSIFSFCADTHPFFRVDTSEIKGLENIYRIFSLDHGGKFDNEKKPINISQQNNGSSLYFRGSSTDSNNSNYRNTTESQLDQEYVPHPALIIIDLICVVYFSLEFLIRFVFSPKKLKFCTALQNIIDFVAILPDYIELFIIHFNPGSREGMSFMEFIFILRMLRLFRIFRLIRHVPGLWILLYTLKASFNELLLMCVFLLIGMVVFASLIHFAESEHFFENIPIGFWWSVVTMTTVGYGDIYPQTALGYLIGSMCAISGLLMIAFTVPIIVSNFVLYYTHVQYGIARQEKDRTHMFDVSMEDMDAPLETTEGVVNTEVNTENESTQITWTSNESEKDKNNTTPVSYSENLETDGNCNRL